MLQDFDAFGLEHLQALLQHRIAPLQGDDVQRDIPSGTQALTRGRDQLAELVLIEEISGGQQELEIGAGDKKLKLR